MNTTSRFSRNLSFVAFAPLGLALVLIAAMVGANAAHAQDETARVIVRGIGHAPATRAEAAHIYRRLDRAALMVCGGDDHSLREVNRSLRESPCWALAMKGALEQVSSPLLPLALADKPARRP